MTSHILSYIIFTPLIGILVIAFLPKGQGEKAKWIALATTLAVGLLTLVAFSQFQLIGEYQMVEEAEWIPQFGVQYIVGTDGISFPMVFLTALMSILACVASFGIKERQKEYFVFYLLLETGMLGTFLSLDLFLFYVFWEVVLVPMYFLIGIWGGPRREYAAIKFFLYTLAGSLFMLLGILAVYFGSTPNTFDLRVIAEQDFTLRFQQWVFMAFFLGFAIKVPIFPFHTWLPDAHVTGTLWS